MIGPFGTAYLAFLLCLVDAGLRYITVIEILPLPLRYLAIISEMTTSVPIHVRLVQSCAYASHNGNVPQIRLEQEGISPFAFGGSYTHIPL